MGTENYPSHMQPLQAQAQAEGLNFGTDFSKVIDTLLEDNKAYDYLKIPNIFIPFLKSAKLTFLDATDVPIIDNEWKAMKCQWIQCHRRGQITNTQILKMDQIGMLLHFNIRRSVGTDNTRINERIAQLTTITHQTGKYTENAGKSGGFNPLRLLGKK